MGKLKNCGHKKYSAWTIEKVKCNTESMGFHLVSKIYNNISSKLKFKCPNGHIFDMSWHSFHRDGQRCAICSGNKKWEIEDIRLKVEKHGYRLLSETYKNNKAKLKVLCPNKHAVEITWSDFLSGSRCPKCYGNKKLTFDYVKNKVQKDGYRLFSKKYKNARSKLNIQCPKGHIFEMEWSVFNSGQRCPTCRASKGEKRISEILSFLGVIYISQKRFEDCIDKQQLPFDFYVPSLNICIEYNGIQHYKSVEWFGGKAGLEDRKKKDKIKQMFCKNRGDLRLLVVKYTDFDNIKEILRREIK